MVAVEEIYLPDPRTLDLHAFQDRVLELVRLFQASQRVRLRIVGTIAAGAPIEACEGDGEAIELAGPAIVAHRHHLLPLLRDYLCPSLQSASADAFEIARVITPLLVGLKVSGKVPIDLDPWLFAGIALLVARTGVAGFCADHAAVDETERPPAHKRPRRARPASHPSQKKGAG